MKPRKRSKRKPTVPQRMLHWFLGLSALLVVVMVTMCFLLHSGIVQTLAYYTGKCSLPTAEVMGVDVSHHQGKIEWDKVCFNFNSRRILTAQFDTTNLSRPIDFAFAKATEGETMRDWRYEYNQEGIRKQQIRFGAYHFFSYTADPARQARNFMSFANLQSGDLPPVLDVEGDPDSPVMHVRHSILTWLRIVEAHYGCKPIVYTYNSFYKKYFEDQLDFADYVFWIARYPYPPSVGHTLWQCSDRGRLIGCPLHHVDINIFNGTREDFDKLRIP